jgi:hypothetical protein
MTRLVGIGLCELASLWALRGLSVPFDMWLKRRAHTILEYRRSHLKRLSIVSGHP